MKRGFRLVITEVLAAAVKRELESLFSPGIFVVDGGEEGKVTCVGLAIPSVPRHTSFCEAPASCVVSRLVFSPREKQRGEGRRRLCPIPPVSPPGCAVPQ